MWLIPVILIFSAIGINRSLMIIQKNTESMVKSTNEIAEQTKRFDILVTGMKDLVQKL
jgi:hypothetical protein